MEAVNIRFFEAIFNDPHELVSNIAFNGQFFLEVTFDHSSQDVGIGRYTNFMTIKFIKILHGFRIPIGSDDNFNIFREDLR